MAPFMDADDDFVGTLSDNDQIPDEETEVPSELPTANGTKRKRTTTAQTNSVKKQKTVKQNEQSLDNNRNEGKDSDVDSDFEFGLEDQTAALDDYDMLVGDGNRPKDRNVEWDGIESLVARRRDKIEPKEQEASSSDEEAEEELGSEASFDGFGAGATMVEDDDGEDEEPDADSNDDVENDSDDDNTSPQVADAAEPAMETGDAHSASEDEVDAVEEERRNAFFAPDAAPLEVAKTAGGVTFQSMHLSRPILKGLAEIGFSSPTPIQAKTIPVALEGKDVVGGAVTGSGKTAAFVIPILERLLYRPKRTATTRVAILMPTRELALQCFNVAKKLASFTDITFGQAIGGLNSREQEKQLKLRPDIVIATPGRFIDLERNSPSFAVNTIEILVLDEADRMLEEGFADELNEILSRIPKSRQTMLFSATMTSKVDDLIRVGLQRPVRLLVDAQKSTVSGLVQEFVRLRPGRETKRLGYLMYLCEKVHTDRCIIFFRQKKEAHRIRVIFALCGMKAAELHGSMTQEQRIQAIEAFRAGRVSYLLATDLASRGLDIKGIESVINYEAPQSHEIYLHRVGRTARAGRSGRACTLAAEPDRKVVKAAVKSAKQQNAQIRQRTILPSDADAWQARIDDLQDEVEAVLREEKEEKVLTNTERDLARADNIVAHRDEILARPKKTWFESEKAKTEAKKKGAEVLNGPIATNDAERKAKKKGKLSNKQKKALQDRDDRKAGLEWRKVGAAMRGKKGAPTVQSKKVKTGKRRS